MKEYKSNLDRVSLIRHKTDIPRAKIVSSKDAAQYAMKFYHEDISIYESMFLIMLNNNNNTIGYVKVSAGGMTGTLVDIRLVAKWCLECLATSFILVHNHPSGNLKFSEADKLCKILNMELKVDFLNI